MKKRSVNLAHARTAFQRKVIERIVKDKVCPFCEEHFLKYHTKPILKKGKYWIITTNFQPYKGSVHHVLAVSRKHATQFSAISPAAQSELFTLLAAEVRRRGIKGGALCMRFGDTDYTSGSVEHLHAHLIVGAKKARGRKTLTMGIGYMRGS